MIDCSNVVNFFRESDRICDLYDCPECPLSSQNNENHISYCPDSLDHENIEKAVEIVQKWSDEHPQRTILEDFLEKYPNAPLNENGSPKACPYLVGYEDEGNCNNYSSCRKCWDRQYEEVVNNA